MEQHVKFISRTVVFPTKACGDASSKSGLGGLLGEVYCSLANAVLLKRLENE
jgi:hypothetical protein